MRLPLSIALSALPITATAAPNVVTDIAPVHSLTQMVLGDLGKATLLLPTDASPHHFSLRPSDARALSSADLVVWVGEGLTPWLEESVDSLASDATSLELLHSEGWTPRPNSEHHHDEEGEGHGDHEEDHDHKDGDHDHKDGGHDHTDGDHDHKDGEHDHKEGEHAHEHEHADHDGHEGHDHGAFDPHAWLDPVIAQVWLGHIAEALTTADPDNAATYRANAATAQANLAGLDAELRQSFDGLTGAYATPHDAYGYFAAHYGLPEAEHIASSDAQSPGASHIAELKMRVTTAEITCVLRDPQTNDGWIDLLIEGTDARSAMIDPIGRGLTVGAELYPTLMRNLANGISTCLGR